MASSNTEEQKNTSLEVVNVSVDIPKERIETKLEIVQNQKEAQTEETKQKTDECAIEILNQSLAFVINTTYLNEPTDLQITPLEFATTGFSKGAVSTFRYYFPDWNFDHPLILLALSVPNIVVLIQMKKNKRQIQNGTNT